MMSALLATRDLHRVAHGTARRDYAPKRSRYDGAALREIRARGQARECARRRQRALAA
ncbi:hypothetical protein [Methylocystis sp. ATCC 49242]|uniref:hypothetical protein n=1 Tax=Methylocystis sp. ATCC 49242 TaxID=622637 RepID=UPI00130D8ACF|nr:hypothetical protein [Methylocystis sp. ATCC 49242]